ncbi:ParB/RepB/Spo0J family partition protein [Anaerolactibacter massiliensis]|uniref:ParB/RepB/Spo0J family partition protein n=1 Tax=Anaerolactibacter massiliensis TaxID=2044573 RepID=UPI000CF8B4BA|nr:ParB N-terminal domain-containing protein [Anaerolactibacter massiliensis]
MKIDEIIVKDRIRKDTGGMMELINDIKANGLINPVTINTDHVLLAGYRRLTACKALGMEDIPVHMVSTESEEQDLKVEISENEIRKEFTMTERLDYARRLQRIESIKAEERMKAGKQDPVQNSAQGKTRDKVAEQVNMSHDTLRKAQVIAENKDKFDPEEFKDWDDGKLSTNKLYTQLKQQKSALSKENQMLKEDHQRLEQQNSKLKHELERQPVKEVVQTVEKLVTPDDYEFLKKDNIRLSEERKQYLEEARKWEQKYKESGKIAPTLDQKATKDINWLTMGIMEFLRSYGGKAWGIYRKSEIWKNSTDELKEQSKNLLAFAQNLYSIVTDGAEEKR